MTSASASASRQAPTSTPNEPAQTKRRPSKGGAPVVPETPGRARIIAIANQKGGVGKSTTAVSLGAALADIGYRVLVADLDPQGNASTGMGIRHDAREISVYDVVVAEADIERAIIPTPVERLHAVPATIDLAGAEIELVSQFSRESRLKRALEPVLEGMYDFILLDCPPSLGLLTINALTAAEELIVPIQCEYYALEGLGQLLRNVSLVQQNINSGLRLSGIVMTMFDPRTKLSEQVVQEVQKFFGGLVYDVIIPRTVRLSEAPGFGQPITVYDARSKGAEAYRQLAQEVASRPVPESPMPSFEDMPIVTPEVMSKATRDGARDEGAIDPVVPEPEVVIQPIREPEPSPAAPQPEPEAVSRAHRPEPEAVSSAPQTKPKAVSKAPKPKPSRSAPEDRVGLSRAPSIAPHVVMEAEREVPEEDLWGEPPIEPEPRVKPPSRPLPPGELPERRVVVIDETSDLDIEASREEAPHRPSREAEPPGVADIGATLDDEKPRGRRWRLFRRGGD